MTQPILSIIIPMRGGVPEAWLKELLKVEGSVEFILVYPPGVSPLKIVDDRLRHIKIPLQGELIQRLSALLNARGTYVLSINCDEYIHPNIVEITREYFRNFPESYFFRLKQRIFEFGDPTIIQEWKPLQNFAETKTRKTGKKPENSQEADYSEEEKQYMMREIPIVPLGNRFDFSAFLKGRKDHRGPHQENFDKKVWKNEMVQENLQDVVTHLKLLGPFKYIPFWTADRLLGLSIQAKFFEEDKIAGHWLPLPEQLRTEDNPPEYPRKHRRYVLAEILLLKKYPRYGYFWNLVLSKGDIFSVFFPKDTIKDFAEKLGLRKGRSPSPDNAIGP